jgi:hypothetical protein
MDLDVCAWLEAAGWQRCFPPLTDAQKARIGEGWAPVFLLNWARHLKVVLQIQAVG